LQTILPFFGGFIFVINGLYVFQGRLVRRFWAFNSSWFTGTLAQLGMQLYLITPMNYNHEFSLFHPCAFEKIIGDYLTYIYENRTDDGEYNFIAPVNLQPLRN